MRSSQTKKRNIIIGALCGVLLLMVVGYAAFSTMLNINGTSKISSNWNIHFDTTRTTETNGVIVGNSGLTGGQKPTGTVTYDGNLTANVTADLIQPGDTVEYHLVVVNDGTIDAKVEKITPANLTEQKGSVIFTRSEELNVGDVIKAGESKPITVTIKYDSSVTSQLETETVEFTLSLDFVQAGGNGGSNIPDVPGVDIMGGTPAAETLKATEVTSGDGLYKDEYEEGRYVYKGADPDNYITFNDEMWRIMSVENDGTLKIIRNENIGSMVWDSKGYRDSTSNGAGGTYCARRRIGCNAWAKIDNFTTGDITGTVLMDAEINTYLNGSYYNSLSAPAKSYIQKHNFSVGAVTENNNDLSNQLSDEHKVIWNGNVGLITVSDYINANGYAICNNLNSNNTYAANTCSGSNYLLSTVILFTITPNDSSAYVFSVNTKGAIYDAAPMDSYGVRPVLYLKSDISLSGLGTSDSPYIIEA